MIYAFKKEEQVKFKYKTVFEVLFKNILNLSNKNFIYFDITFKENVIFLFDLDIKLLLLITPKRFSIFCEFYCL